MKLVPYYIICLAAVLLQITLFGGGFSLNLVLIAIVLSTLELRASDVVPIALLCGLFLDIASGAFFGFHILFLLFAALGAKFILHLGERASGFWNVILTLGIFEVLYLFIQLVMVFSADRYDQLGVFVVNSLWQLGLTLLVGALGYGGLLYWQSQSDANQTKKRWLRG